MFTQYTNLMFFSHADMLIKSKHSEIYIHIAHHFIFSSCCGSIPLILMLIKKDGGLTILCHTLREESNVEKVLRNKNAELKNANFVQNSHSFIPHFLNHSHHLQSLIAHFSGILDHSQSFILHFLNSRLHFFQCSFLFFKEI